VDPDEGLLHQVLGPLPVADRALDEIHEPHVIPVRQLRERAALPGQETRNEHAVVGFLERRRPRLFALRAYHCQFDHGGPPFGLGTTVPSYRSGSTSDGQRPYPAAAARTIDLNAWNCSPYRRGRPPRATAAR